LIALSVSIKYHYNKTGKLLGRLNDLVVAAETDIEKHRKAGSEGIKPDFKAKTA